MNSIFPFNAPQPMQRLRPPLPDCELYLKCLIEQCWQHAPKVFIILCCNLMRVHE